MHKKLKAYTLLELIVAMGIFTIISAVLIPFTVNFLKSNSAKSAATDLSSLIYSYQQESYGGNNSKSYGFKFSNTSYTLFVGSSFAAAESTEVINLPAGITISSLNLTGGATEMVFTSGSIKPSTNGTIRITDEFVTYEIQINQEGFINIIRI
jgi:prepilin-type N-terminal cleavage/methylation domain-containing protein